MAIKCRIVWDLNTQAYLINLGSDARLKAYVEVLKQSVPSGDRSYDSDTRTWFVKEGYGEGLRLLAQSVFGIHNVSFVSRTVAEQQQANFVPLHGPTVEQVVGEFLILTGFDKQVKLDYDTAKRAYRRTALTLHPDKGGDAVKMARLNEVWKRVEKEYFKK